MTTLAVTGLVGQWKLYKSCGHS